MTTTATVRLYTPEEASEQLPFHPRTLVRFAREEKIGCVKLGRKILFTDEHIAAFIAAGDKPRRDVPDAKPTRNPKYTR